MLQYHIYGTASRAAYRRLQFLVFYWLLMLLSIWSGMPWIKWLNMSKIHRGKRVQNLLEKSCPLCQPPDFFFVTTMYKIQQNSSSSCQLMKLLEEHWKWYVDNKFVFEDFLDITG